MNNNKLILEEKKRLDELKRKKLIEERKEKISKVTGFKPWSDFTA